MASPVRDEPAGLRRFEHPWRIVAVVALLIVSSIAAFLLGRVAEAPSLNAAVDATRPIAVYAHVSNRVVDSRQSYAGVVAAGTEVKVVVPSVTSPSVVTRAPLKTGAAYTPGHLLGVVSGVPFYGLSGPLPLYRDLTFGDRGDDVTYLQRSLARAGFAVPVTGIVGYSTFAAVRALFARDGFNLTNPIPYAQLVAVAPGSSIVLSSAAVGDVVSPSKPLAVFQTTPDFVTFDADPVAVQQLKVGEGMTIQIGNSAYSGTLVKIGPFSDGSNGSSPGHTVEVTTNAKAFQSVAPRTSVALLAAGDVSRSLAVPLTAIHQDNTGDYVLMRVVRKGASTNKAVRVKVLRTGGGWAAVSSATLQSDDSVLVS